MLRRLVYEPRFRTLSWTLLDQGLVSTGMFLTQLVLARQLVAAEYGVFVLVFSVLLTLQLCNATLIFYPMSVRVPAAPDHTRPPLFGASLVLMVALSAALGVGLCLGLLAFRRPDLALPAFAAFMAWQMQEALRRALLSSLRQSAAIAGDAVTYGGQALVTCWLSVSGSLSVRGAFYALAIGAVAGSLTHMRRLTIARPRRTELREVLADYWSIGGMPSLGNGLLGQVRNMFVPWVLALLAGTAQTAGFQAAANVVNLSNPLIIGLGNLIPQAAAMARVRGETEAWRTARHYALLAAPAIIVFSGIVLVAPEMVLRLLYGAKSEYLSAVVPLRIMALVNLSGFAIEIVLSFLCGIARIRLAFGVNFAGMVATVVLAPPLIGAFGLGGGCAALLLSNVARIALVRLALLNVTSPRATKIPGRGTDLILQPPLTSGAGK